MLRHLKKILSKVEGSVSFEAIWAGLVVTMFFVPTAYLYRYSEVHLDASWAQRSAARNEAINGNCNGEIFLPIPIDVSTNVHSQTLVTCTKVDGEKDVPSADKFWKKLDTVSNSKFRNFTRDMKDKGDFKASKGSSYVRHTKNLELGDSSSGGTLASILQTFSSGQSALLAPSTDYYIYDKAHWKEGHDKRVWEEFSPDAKKLFPNVYPSASTSSRARTSSSSKGTKVAGKCSFHGSTQVLTASGYVAIQNISVGASVWSRNAQTGEMGWKDVLAQYSNPYDETVHVKIRDLGTRAEQTILSNQIHPFFVQLQQEQNVFQKIMVDGQAALPQSSEGHFYTGPIRDGYWVDAADLQQGHRLLNRDNSWAEVVSVSVIEKPLKAYNLTVADFQTYFVAANENAAPVWVHNKCWDKLPANSTPSGATTKDGRTIYDGPKGNKIYQGKDGRYYDLNDHPPTIGRDKGLSQAELNKLDPKAKARHERLSKNKRKGKDFTKAGKDSVKNTNKELHGGKMVCEGCDKEAVPAKRHKQGVSPPNNEAHVDHIIRREDNGSGTPDNGQVLCRNCNVNIKH